MKLSAHLLKGRWCGRPLSDALDLNFNQTALPEYFISLDCLEGINLHIKVSQAIGFATSVPAQWRAESWHIIAWWGLLCSFAFKLFSFFQLLNDNLIRKQFCSDNSGFRSCHALIKMFHCLQCLKKLPWNYHPAVFKNLPAPTLREVKCHRCIILAFMRRLMEA